MTATPSATKDLVSVAPSLIGTVCSRAADVAGRSAMRSAYGARAAQRQRSATIWTTTVTGAPTTDLNAFRGSPRRAPRPADRVGPEPALKTVAFPSRARVRHPPRRATASTTTAWRALTTGWSAFAGLRKRSPAETAVSARSLAPVIRPAHGGTGLRAPAVAPATPEIPNRVPTTAVDRATARAAVRAPGVRAAALRFATTATMTGMVGSTRESRTPDLAVRPNDAGSCVSRLVAVVRRDVEAKPEAGFREAQVEFVERGGEARHGAGVARS